MNATGTLQLTTPTEREIVMTRDFDAPRSLVFDALTKPELLKQWYGPPGWSLVECKVDLRVGGAWRFVTRREDGTDIVQRGFYREVTPPERLVNTEEWDDWDAGETLVTAVLVEHRGRTTVTSTLLFTSQEVRDTLIASGMTDGVAATYDKLAAFLASIA